MSNAKIQSIEDEEAFWTGIRGLWSHHHSAANILHVFFQKATEYQLQKCGEAIFDMHLIVLKVVNHFCELTLLQIILKFFDLKPQQRFARILIG